MTKKVHIISLGCAKNTVDSDSMVQLLNASGYRLIDNPARADVLIVNTCGFIAPARQESYQLLNELAAQKQKGQLLLAAGCLTQRYGAEVVQQVPGVDAILGTRRWMDVLEVIESLRGSGIPKPLYHLPDEPSIGKDEKGVLRAAIQGASAYLKIADGCRRPCAFCAIPLIKGPAVSRPMQTILAEGRVLRERGVREIVLIAQDTSDYGHDLGMEDGLSLLLEKMIADTPSEDWLRILYTYPGAVTERLIEIMTSHKQILHYLDLPLQHAHPSVLKRMRRPANLDWIYRTLSKMRSAMPDLALRTTFIVGFPGETEEEFQFLLEFVKEMQFDRIGTFQYSFEKGTPSEAFGDPVPAEEKQERYDRLMQIQQGISLRKNQAFIGKTLDVLVEGKGDGVLIGRSYRDAPEIDGMVIIEGDKSDLKHSIGEILPVRINSAMVYDLAGKLIPPGVQ